MNTENKFLSHINYTNVMFTMFYSKRNLDALKILQSIELELRNLDAEVKIYFCNNSFVFSVKDIVLAFNLAGMYIPEDENDNRRLMLDIKFLDVLNPNSIGLVHNLIDRFICFAKENKYDFLSFENVDSEQVELFLQEKGFEPLYFKRTELKYVKVL